MPMDVLSEVLRVVRLEGALFFNAEFSAPWCISERHSSQIVFHLSLDAGHLILYQLLTEGRANVWLPDGGSEELTAVAIILSPHGDPHFLVSGSPEKPVDA